MGGLQRKNEPITQAHFDSQVADLIGQLLQESLLRRNLDEKVSGLEREFQRVQISSREGYGQSSIFRPKTDWLWLQTHVDARMRHLTSEIYHVKNAVQSASAQCCQDCNLLDKRMEAFEASLRILPVDVETRLHTLEQKLSDVEARLQSIRDDAKDSIQVLESKMELRHSAMQVRSDYTQRAMASVLDAKVQACADDVIQIARVKFDQRDDALQTLQVLRDKYVELSHLPQIVHSLSGYMMALRTQADLHVASQGSTARQLDGLASRSPRMEAHYGTQSGNPCPGQDVMRFQEPVPSSSCEEPQGLVQATSSENSESLQEPSTEETPVESPCDASQRQPTPPGHLDGLRNDNGDFFQRGDAVEYYSQTKGEKWIHATVISVGKHYVELDVQKRANRSKIRRRAQAVGEPDKVVINTKIRCSKDGLQLKHVDGGLRVRSSLDSLGGLLDCKGFLSAQDLQALRTVSFFMADRIRDSWLAVASLSMRGAWRARYIERQRFARSRHCTVPCWYFARGRCDRDLRCPFSHAAGEEGFGQMGKWRQGAGKGEAGNKTCGTGGAQDRRNGWDAGKSWW